jgi:hypothetical protein
MICLFQKGLMNLGNIKNIVLDHVPIVDNGMSKINKKLVLLVKIVAKSRLQPKLGANLIKNLNIKRIVLYVDHSFMLQRRVLLKNIVNGIVINYIQRY